LDRNGFLLVKEKNKQIMGLSRLAANKNDSGGQEFGETENDIVSPAYIVKLNTLPERKMKNNKLFFDCHACQQMAPQTNNL